jgi:hypothetical protein
VLQKTVREKLRFYWLRDELQSELHLVRFPDSGRKKMHILYQEAIRSDHNNRIQPQAR